jgi:predicted component of type VI protein secretion system
MWLTITAEGRPACSVHVDVGGYVLGRAAGCDLVIDDSHVSARHARLDVDRSGAWLIDLGSTNGTFVGDRRVDRAVWVAAPVDLRLGTTVVRLSPDQPAAAFDPWGDAAGPPTAAVGPTPPPGPPRTPPQSMLAQYPPPGPPGPGQGQGPAGPPPGPAYDVRNAGPVAGHDVQMDGHQVAGRDMVIHEGLKLQTRMRSSAKNAIRVGCLAFLVGFGLFGYFVLTWNSEIFDAITEPSAEPPSDLPSPLPWLPLGAALMFGGLVLIVVGLLVPRDRIVTREGP